ncbi:MAG: RiPP maturation radical SAM C-methyltransferase [Pseudomonadota bacterium]
MNDIVFALMPFVALERPSVALGTLTASLRAHGISAKTVYANLRYAEHIGLTAYTSVDNSDITSQIGEWIFSQSAFRTEGVTPEELLLRLSGGTEGPAGSVHGLRQARQLAGQLVEQTAAEIVAMNPRIVGCSSVFQQQCGSLALLRRVKELNPAIVTMIGGANCEGAMGAAVHRQYEWIDFVVSGEADLLLPKLCQDIFDQGPDIPADHLPYGVFGPAMRGGQKTGEADGKRTARAVIHDLDSLPMPDYDDYFEQLEALSIREFILPAIAVETSRGCWWGEKHHCTFCGLNGQGMTFRAKSADRALEELSSLSERHKLNKFMTVDNILDNKYFDRMLPALAAAGDSTFFYEIKSNLRRARVEALSNAGIRWVQPGIEALHDDLLKLLKKGATAAINVQLLKWARTYGIWVVWNYLCNAPGDRREWYDEVADWLPKISHLQPPSGAAVTAIRFDRFSPYFNDAAEYGLNLVPYGGYETAYPLSSDQLKDQAYFFRHDGPAAPIPQRLQDGVAHWYDIFFDTDGLRFPTVKPDAPYLMMLADRHGAEVTDTRPIAKTNSYRLDRLQAAICAACDSATKLYGIRMALKKRGLDVDDDTVMEALEGLCAVHLILRINDTYLCLAFDRVPVPYMRFTDFAGGLTLLSKPKEAVAPISEEEQLNPSLKRMFSL